LAQQPIYLWHAKHGTQVNASGLRCCNSEMGKKIFCVVAKNQYELSG
jgi:hypothetical protein